jgi:transcriptional regulator GlxA family with amidase domain
MTSRRLPGASASAAASSSATSRALSLSPAAAARRLRLAHARFLLEGRGRSLADIAAETGFCDASHLIRAFRDSEGLTPDAYRRRAREALASTSE